jgi:hypothetical protein
MRFRAVLGLFAVLSTAAGVVAIVAPGSVMHAIWPARQAAGAELFVRGWGACLLALAGLAWTHRNTQDPFVRRSISSALFIYFGLAAGVWLADARAIGWTLLSAVTFVGLASFASAFGYLRFLKLAGVQRPL